VPALHLRHDPRLEPLLLRRLGADLVDLRRGNEHRAIVVHHDPVVGEDRDTAATDLPMGSQKLLEIVRALMAEPRLLLLDEPAAGLNDAETAELAELLRAVRDAGISVVVVEHNMSLVMGVADQVIVLDAGSVVASGTPRDIQQDARVIAAYVGSEAVT